MISLNNGFSFKFFVINNGPVIEVKEDYNEFEWKPNVGVGLKKNKNGSWE